MVGLFVHLFIHWELTENWKSYDVTLVCFHLLIYKLSQQVSFKNSPVRHTIPSYSDAEVRVDWEEIRKLDEEQNWTERTQVVTKEDHKLNIDAAKVRNIFYCNIS